MLDPYQHDVRRVSIRGKDDTTEMNATKEMFLTLQSNMEMLQLENKRLYEENIKLRSSKVSVARSYNQDGYQNTMADSRGTFTPTATTEDGADSSSEENSNMKEEEDQVKFLKSKLQGFKRMNKTLRILVQFNKDMADEIASFKSSEEVLLEFVKKVNVLEEKYEEKIENMKNDYETRIQNLESIVSKKMNSDEKTMKDIKSEKEFWKQQTMKLTQQSQEKRRDGEQANSRNCSRKKRVNIEDMITNIRRGAGINEKQKKGKKIPKYKYKKH